jgi:hypothetical protein
MYCARSTADPLSAAPTPAWTLIGGSEQRTFTYGRELRVAADLVSVGLGLLVLDMEERLGWPGRQGVIGYESDRDGPLLGPALDELRAAARARRTLATPGWTLLGDEYGYAARGLAGSRLFLWSTVALRLTATRVARLASRPVPAFLLIAARSSACSCASCCAPSRTCSRPGRRAPALSQRAARPGHRSSAAHGSPDLYGSC